MGDHASLAKRLHVLTLTRGMFGMGGGMQFFNADQILGSARSALKPALMLSMGGTVLGAVLIYGLFGIGSAIDGTGSLLLHFIGSLACLFWVLFGLTALAHQLHMQIIGEPLPDTVESMSFAWSRMQPLLILPAWAGGGLLALLIGEMLLLVLAKIPGLGLIWLALIGVPLLLLNTVIVILLLLAVFNIAARVAISDADAGSLRDALWHLLRHRLPELLIYNLGGVVASMLVAAVLLSPLWFGAQLSLSLMDVVSSEQVQRVLDGGGFWGGLAHLVGLLIFGGLLSVVAGVPGVVITHMTLLLHLELDKAAQGEGVSSADEGAVVSGAVEDDAASDDTAGDSGVDAQESSKGKQA
ncbi:MAG: hypothetical protein COS82_00010 [Zetaproteobacteria bacterium CG06_land_8_20_14_3_00_59_53]|nr:MAG: hypothetical protein AUK36_11715 [Zetaproteobacteria bacterium CG2_30_59_37]PIO88688.1 MAG: hypothetical protein COX56_11680 [Zetaproteobacteria bacterium CG23_combo_of_CG06-09_8_20_14_all_59_86]PIQ63957.1 MAG: hypothetical protein COV97_11760 [Zetaproteobacteria bacterium CG11_big_fil_rev_8_21_14_0_20_59_439]PIU71647.1 MAG: hypothetical protein COS82_00010 [Zetaproteobacteria bacterium CG06_land_8_20_14_3_00_59_53]PIU96044.1 MAG: hypothetical protein COS62_10910 [Zetaproteobacteria bac